MSTYLQILQEEMIPATGCTEPIALAYAAAKARETLGCEPEKALLVCSGNMVKNAKAVTVPNSGGMVGIEAAVTLGVVGGAADRTLEVLAAVTPADIERTRELLAAGFCSCTLAEGVSNLYIDLTLTARDHSARVVIENHHTEITCIERDGACLFSKEAVVAKKTDRRILSLPDIFAFADEVPLEALQPVIEPQIQCNDAIADRGMREPYGAQVSRAVSRLGGVYSRAKARAAAASEARMCGCPMPVVINSGSGNQGITVSVPLIAIASDEGVPHEKLCRALAVSNLVSVYLKHFIGSLSAFCGAVTAACGAAAGVAYLRGDGWQIAAAAIENALASAGGIVCDGAKASCAAKVATALDTAFYSYDMAKNGCSFRAGDGLVGSSFEDTVQRVCYVGRVGMAQTDIEILKVMLGQAQI